MFSLSVLTLTLKRSRDYQRTVSVVTLAAVVLLWQANWPWFLALLLTTMLLLMAYNTLQQGRPHANCQQWVWREPHWLVYDSQGVIEPFTEARIRYDVGWFMRIDFCNKTHRRSFILFHDQISPAERRALYLLQLSDAKC